MLLSPEPITANIGVNMTNEAKRNEFRVERPVIPLCEHLKTWKNHVYYGSEPCNKPAKFIIHYENGDKLACGVHANAYNKRAKNRNWDLAEPLKNENN